MTVCALPPGALVKDAAPRRLEYFQENFGDFSLEFTVDDFENSTFSSTIHRLLMMAFKNAFAARTDSSFRPFFQVAYTDSAEMITVGGCLCSTGAGPKVEKKLRADLPFLFRAAPYKIQNLNLTERERVLFDLAVTRGDSDSKQAISLRALGFRKRHFDAYRDLIRFLPRYHESII